MLPETRSWSSCRHGLVSKVPRHLAVILDGNRRWAERHGLPLADAYQAGADRVRELLCWCDELGIPFVTVWALSQDNLYREPKVVDQIVEAITAGLRGMAAEARWPIRVVGSLERLPHQEQAAALRAVERDSATASGARLTVAVAYDGRQEIVAAVQELVRAYTAGSLAGELTEQRLVDFLCTAGQPDVDLLIRTSGETRLSGFMPWQTAYAEFYFTPVYWPDFDRGHFGEALEAYADRDRRRGK
ncbi:polyprenyl diphosphate synthase [Streptomyces sp. UNOB3_S3]|uniref:polyprenyl diphosphate synthase n=1 Tax=Streptomyces sp. UNOB3_S3 TaxID=2871682 RepID=UPI001E562D9B|nr:polyprenyl diphosphate synthase [Streptomyces sp. UNOB3_S3]MCC3778323.1 di-trans,poly-cis-decaprenylcistransferase [Streptomyces sp. UNOB3_S3]